MGGKKERYISLDLNLMSERQPFYHFACLFSYSGSYIVDTAVKLENYIFVPSPFPMALLPWSRVVRNLRNPLWGHSVVSERMVQNWLGVPQPVQPQASLLSLSSTRLQSRPNCPSCVRLLRFRHHLLCGSPGLLLYSLPTALLGY